MTDNLHTNKRTPSTTWGWRKVKISPAPPGRRGQPPEGRHPALGCTRDPRKPLSVTIVYRGGAEAWWELRARGIVLRRPGHVALDEVLRLLQG